MNYIVAVCDENYHYAVTSLDFYKKVAFIRFPRVLNSDSSIQELKWMKNIDTIL
jgi:hypothetical protein|tara:strand:+ start:120 stop:281 length:162 start_codon:yes stop_codon:yes gene_type:complete